jgi:hypothetical protein
MAENRLNRFSGTPSRYRFVAEPRRAACHPYHSVRVAVIASLQTQNGGATTPSSDVVRTANSRYMPLSFRQTAYPLAAVNDYWRNVAIAQVIRLDRRSRDLDHIRLFGLLV